MYDVLIIGGGAIGCLTARELTKYALKICLIEKEADVAMGASGANSGIVHAGYDSVPGTLKARFNVEGSALFEKLARELDIPYQKKGSLVLALCNEDIQTLEKLMENGVKNRVFSLSLLSKEEARNLEPLLSTDVKGALYAKTAAITCPYSLTIAAAENAVLNGAEFKLNQNVCGIRREEGYFAVRTQNETFFAKTLVNAGGIHADEISALAGAERCRIIPCKGEYLLFDKNSVKPGKTLFPPPSAYGKGVLVTPTVNGNLLIGPSAKNIEDKEDTATSAEAMEQIILNAKRIFPHIPLKDTITQFTGNRAVMESYDFFIRPSEMQKGFIHVAGISSPGLTAAPAIAKYVANLLEQEGLELKENKNFNPERKSIPAFASLSNKERNALIMENPSFGKIVCRCEQITEAEIIKSIRRPLGAATLDGVKRRVRAGMGRCQGNFCSFAILKILSEELKKPLEKITKSGGISFILTGKTK